MEVHKGRIVDGLLDFTPDPNKTLTDRIMREIDRALVEKNQAETPRNYLGGSRLGVECLRALAYEYMKAPKDKGFDGKTLRRFRMGHWHEDESAELLRMAGFRLMTHDKNGDQFGFSVANGRIAGHIDGVLTDGPVSGISYPALWEHKIMNNKKWTECNSKGVIRSHPVYYGQMQIYMAHMDLDISLFHATNTDTSEMLFQLIPFRADVAQRLSDRGVAVITATDARELPRITHDKSDFRCKWCDYQKTCWKGGV